jgi:hypothetical protein
MIWNKVDKLLQYFKKHGYKYLPGAACPAMGMQALTVTGGGTGTDLVVFASNYVEGVQLSDMADTAYQVFLGHSATPAAKYAGTKLTTGFTITGLGAETVDILVIGRLADMPAVV